MSPTKASVGRCVSAKDNPFAVQRTDALHFDFQETHFVDVNAFAKRAQTLNYRGAILGRHGHGKTTLLCDLHLWLGEQQIDCELMFVPREKGLQGAALEKMIRRGQGGCIILIDGLERLPFFARQRLLNKSKSFGGFVATTHRPSRLRKLIHCRTSHRTLLAVLDSLELNQPEIRAAGISLLSKHHGNMRCVLRGLYDQFANGQFQIHRS